MRPCLAKPATTRDRILNAAIHRFSTHSYEDTGLRDIAADVDVDVAYVHRCFGSKERLFAEAVQTAVRPERLLASSRNELPRVLTDELFASEERGRKEAGALDIIVRSLSSPDATRVLHEFVLKDFIQPLADKLDDPTKSRSFIIASLSVGVGILRKVLRIEPCRGAERGEFEFLIGDTIKYIADRSFPDGSAGSKR